MRKLPKIPKSRNDIHKSSHKHNAELSLIESFNKIDVPIIVEGKNDRKALKDIGVENRIYAISGKPLYEFCEAVAEKHNSVLVLTDYDDKGKLLAAKIADFLGVFGVKTNMHLRRRIFRTAKVAHVESFK